MKEGYVVIGGCYVEDIVRFFVVLGFFFRASVAILCIVLVLEVRLYWGFRDVVFVFWLILAFFLEGNNLSLSVDMV